MAGAPGGPLILSEVKLADLAMRRVNVLFVTGRRDLQVLRTLCDAISPARIGAFFASGNPNVTDAARIAGFTCLDFEGVKRQVFKRRKQRPVFVLDYSGDLWWHALMAEARFWNVSTVTMVCNALCHPFVRDNADLCFILPTRKALLMSTRLLAELSRLVPVEAKKLVEQALNHRALIGVDLRAERRVFFSPMFGTSLPWQRSTAALADVDLDAKADE